MDHSNSIALESKPLKHKVALLVHVDGKHGRSLAAALALYGAEIALVFNPQHAAQARETKKLIESLGRRCLQIPEDSIEYAFSTEVVRRTLREFGRLDIFIDFSSWSGEDYVQDNQGDAERRWQCSEKAGPTTMIDLMVAALQHMVGSNHSHDQAAEIGRSKTEMRVAQELINKPVISIKEGQELGKVHDFYVDRKLTHLSAIYLGGEGLLNRRETLIRWTDVATFGKDAILVEDADCVVETSSLAEFASYIRRDEIVGRPVDTPRDTKIGRIGDVIVDDEATVAGFTLPQVYVSGPVAANRAISRSAVIDPGANDGVITASLSDAEKANFKVVYKGLFAESSVSVPE